jgi:IMP dehydrogenase
MPEGQTPDNKKQFAESAIALTFDDVLIRPAASNVLPNEVDVSSRVTRSISLHIPVISRPWIRSPRPSSPSPWRKRVVSA